MNAIILAISMIIGYCFALKYKPFHYNFMRKKDQHIYFHSALYGLYILSTSYFLTLIIAFVWHICKTDFNSIIHWKDFLSCFLGYTKKCFHQDPSGTNFTFIFILVGIGLIGPIIGNFRIKGDKELEYFKKAIEGIPLDVFLFYAMNESFIVMITLASERFYIGYIMDETPDPERKSISILPLISGYRVQNILEFTTNYIEKLSPSSEEEINNDNREDIFDQLYDMKKIILINHISSVAKFDPDLYEEKFSPKIPIKI